MTDEQNQSTDVASDELAPVSAEPAQVRLGGQAGVRVTQRGEQQIKRVTSIQDSDNRAIPVAVLAEVRALVDVHGESPTLTAAERLLAVRDLLAPWML